MGLSPRIAVEYRRLARAMPAEAGASAADQRPHPHPSGVTTELTRLLVRFLVVVGLETKRD